jgi:hypothetical protein
MKIEINEALVRRNTRIAQITTFGGLLVLIGGMILSFRNPNAFGLSFGALLVGFALSQVGIYYTNRWGRRPRPYEVLNQALKGLDGKYTLYHYRTPSSHLLVGPAGLWILMPRHQRGTIRYANGRWQQKGGNLYLKIFAQEGLGRPDLEISSELEHLQNYLKKRLPEENVPPVQAALVFTNEKTVIDIDEDAVAPADTLQINKLKDFIRKTAKSKPISMERVTEVQEAISGEQDGKSSDI